MHKSVEEIYLWNNSGWKFFLWTNKKEKYNNYINIGGVLPTFWKSEREKGKIMRVSIHFTSKCFFFVKTPPPHGPAYMESGFPHSFPLLIFTDKAWLWPWGWSSSWGTVVSTLGNRHAKCFQAETLCMLKTSQVYRLCFLYYPQMMLFCQKKPNSTMKSQKLWPGRTLLSA